MIIENYSKVRQNFKKFCDIVAEHEEELIITRERGKNIVLISVDKYNSLVHPRNDQNEK